MQGKYYLFSYSSFDPSLFSDLPIEILPGVWLVQTPIAALDNAAGTRSSEKESIILANFVYPAYGLTGIDDPHFCIKIDKMVPNKDKLFWNMISALLLVKPLFVRITGSFTYGDVESGLISNPEKIDRQTNISLNAIKKTDLVFEKKDIEEMQLIFPKIMQIHKDRNVYKRPNIILTRFFHGMLWERLAFADSIFLQFFPGIDSFAANPGWKHMNKISERVSKFFSEYSIFSEQNFLPAKLATEEGILSLLQDLWTKHRNSVFHGYPKGISSKDTRSSDLEVAQDLFYLMEILRLCTKKMLLLDQSTFQDYCGIPIPSNQDTKDERAQREKAANAFFKQELRLYTDPNLMNGAMLGLVIMLIPIGALTGLYATVRYYLVDTIYYPLSYLLLGPPIFFGLIFFGILGGTFCFPKKGDPVAILNQDGIRHYRFGFIPWKEIDEFGTYSVPKTPLEAIGIRVKNNEKISKQSSIAGKLDFFWAKLIGYPPIKIAGIALENEEVISFAKQFLNN